jgi:TonB family protein
MISDSAVRHKKFSLTYIMMNDRRRFSFAIMLALCIHLLLLAGGELFFYVSNRDQTLHENSKTVSVLQVVLGISAQENISSSEMIQDKIILETEPSIVPNKIIAEEILSTQKQIDEVLDQFVDTENNLINSSGIDAAEMIVSESVAVPETIADNKTLFPSSAFSHEAEKNQLNEMIYSLIEKEKHYPALARRRNIEGIVGVTISVSAAGELEDCNVSSSSGTTILDQAAINVIKSIFPLHIVLQSETELIITIRYSLND